MVYAHSANIELNFLLFPREYFLVFAVSRLSTSYSIPTLVKYKFLKSSVFVVAMFLWSNRVVIRINIHKETTKSPKWPLGGGVEVKNFFLSTP